MWGSDLNYNCRPSTQYICQIMYTKNWICVWLISKYFSVGLILHLKYREGWLDLSNGGVKLLLIPTLAKKKLSLSLAVCLHLNRSKFLLMTVLLITGKKIFFFLKNIVLSPSLDVAHHAKVKVKSRKSKNIYFW